MRISDWSSDVCSSDLWVHNPTSGMSTSAEPPISHQRSAPILGTYRRRRGAGAASAAVSSSSVSPVTPLATPHPSGVRASFKHRQDRSEEHTSELQSLMRISYAVFCLKKKTRTLIKTLAIKSHTTH